MKKVILTTMCMIYKKDLFLVQDRIKNDWPGINFPGGKVEDSESIVESCIREIKEETNLDIFNLEFVGYYEWNNIDENRHLSILFKTSNYLGEIKASKEGKLFFIREDEIDNYKQANDFKEIYKIMKNGL